MLMGFIPVGVALISLIATLRGRAAPARWLWSATIGLVLLWTVYHGSHHLSLLSTYAAW
jgi:hypothetical protein